MIFFDFRCKLTLLLIVVSVLFIGCKNNNEIELRIKKKGCIDKVIDNRELLRKILDVLKNTSSEEYLRIQKNCLYIDSIRGMYSHSLSRKDLLIYSDSIVNRYRKIGDTDMDVINDLESLRNEFETADSAAILNFYYLTLSAEKDLLFWYARDVSSDSFTPVITSFMVKDHFMLNDTIIVLARVELLESKLWDFDFSNVVCRNTTTGKIIAPHIVAIGPHHIFHYQPKARGTYVVDGKAHVSVYGEWETDARIHHQFVIE